MLKPVRRNSIRSQKNILPLVDFARPDRRDKLFEKKLEQKFRSSLFQRLDIPDTVGEFGFVEWCLVFPLRKGELSQKV